MAEDLYDAALVLVFWCGLFFIGGLLALGSAFLYRVLVERIGARLARAHARDVYVDRDLRHWGRPVARSVDFDAQMPAPLDDDVILQPHLRKDGENR